MDGDWLEIAFWFGLFGDGSRVIIAVVVHSAYVIDQLRVMPF